METIIKRIKPVCGASWWFGYYIKRLTSQKQTGFHLYARIYLTGTDYRNPWTTMEGRVV